MNHKDRFVPASDPLAHQAHAAQLGIARERRALAEYNASRSALIRNGQKKSREKKEK